MSIRLSRWAASLAAAALVLAGALVGSAPASAAVGPGNEVIALVNQQRAANGLGPLMSDPVLDNAAQSWANYLLATGTFQHSSSDWRDSMISGAGWRYSGENIAAGYTTASSVMAGWMGSAGHRANILGSSYVGIGVGYVQGGPWGTYWVQIFASSLPRVAPGAPPTITGSTTVGGTLTATTSGWPSGTSIGWTWQSNGQTIPGATSATYVPSISDQGRTITATASGWKAGLYTSYTVSAPTAAVTGSARATRLAGATRYETAVAISTAGFSPGVPVVYVASGANFPDALSAAPAASLLGGPLLLTPGDTLPASVRTELVRLQPERIVVVGGRSVVSESVLGQIAAIAPTTRVSGATRYETSRTIVADAFASASTVYLATGRNFPDALTASAAAAHLDAPVVLVDGGASSVDAETLGLLQDLGVTTVRIAGATAVISPALEQSLATAGFTVQRIGGADRYATGTAIVRGAFTSSTVAYVASGLNFPDALAGAALAGSVDAPLFITTGTCVPDAVSRAMTDLGVTSVVLLGGTPTLGASVASFQRC